jgi:AcrR family transcriptional regulator
MVEAAQKRAPSGIGRRRLTGRRKGTARKADLRKGEQTAVAILDAAEALFAERGYVGTTMRTVAKAVGLRDPSLYNHFANKDALYAAVIERTYRPIAEALDRLVKGKSNWSEMRQAISSINAVLAEHPNFARLLQLEILTGRGRLHPMLDRWLRVLFGQGQTATERLQGQARIDQEERLLRIIAVNNVILGYCTAGTLYKLLGGKDLLAEHVRRKQDRVLRIIVEAFERTPPVDSKVS